MDEFSQKAQLLNQMNISSCETAQALVGGIWPQMETTRATICEAVGNSQGVFSDWAAARQGCNNGNRRDSTIAGNTDASMKDQLIGEPHNYTWEALRKSRSEEHTYELQSIMRTSYAGFCLKKKKSTLTY